MKISQYPVNWLVVVSACALVLSGSLTGAQTPSPPEWKALGTSYHRGNEVKVFYDPQSIKQTADRAQVWLKQVERFEDAQAKRLGLDELKNHRKFLKLSIDGYDQYAYSTTLVEFNCQAESARTLCFVDYDEAGKVIGKQCVEEPPFAPVMTEATQKLFDITCKPKK